MQNDVELTEDNIIKITVVGDQNEASVGAMGKSIDALATSLQDKKLPILVLDDIRQIGKVTSEGRKLVVEIGKKLPLKKLAFVGRIGILRLGSNLILQAMGQGEKVKYFEDYDKAVSWLKKS